MTTRSHEPRGATEAFIGEVAAKFGAPFVQSWLSAKTCRFTDTTIFTLSVARDRINQYCGDLAKKHGVTVAVCADVTAGVYREQDGKR